jgi:hypothetical protein
MEFFLGRAISNGESETEQSPQAFESNRPQESHDSALESGFDIAILLLDPDALLIETQHFSDIVSMTGQITIGSHGGQDHTTEHLFFLPQPTLWDLHDLPCL